MAIQNCLELHNEIEKVIEVCIEAIKSKRKILWCGNGGSAADSIHLSTELVGRFKKNREPISSLSLTTNVALLTALANDYGYNTIFSRQVAAIGQEGDVCIGISTSGESESVVNALKTARSSGLKTVAFTGASKCSLWDYADITISVPSSIVSHIQECHITLGQFICGELETRIFGE